MIQDDFRQGRHRDELLEVKKRVAGSAGQDSGKGLSDHEFLHLELEEIASKRKSRALPLVVVGGLMAISSPGAANLLTKGFAFVFGSLLAFAGLWLLWSYSRGLASLRERLKSAENR